MLSVLVRRGTNEIKCTLTTMQKRNFLLGKKVGERKYKLRDKMDKEWALIYKAPMEYYLAACNHITTLSAILMCGYALNRFMNRNEVVSGEKRPYEMLGGRLLMADTDYYYFALGFVVVNVVLRITAYRFPLRLYRHGQNYTAIFEGQVPFRKDKYMFVQGAVKEEAIKGVLPWRDARFKINGERKVVLLYESFKTPSELFDMMKKPVKIKRYEEDEISRN